MNKIILMGRLTADPKIDYTRSDDPKKYARYTLAVNRRYKRKGEAEADFIPCIAWGAMAEFAEKYMKKGAMFAITGRIQIRSWDKEGERRWSTDVIVEEQYFTGDARRSDSADPGKKDKDEEANGTEAGFYPIEEMEDDDLPF